MTASLTPLEPDRRRAVALWALLALAHGVLLLGWMAAAPRLRVARLPERALVWIAPQAQPAPVARPAPAAAQPPLAVAPTRRATPQQPSPMPPEPQAITLPAAEAAPVATAPPEPPASGPLLDNAATRAAIRRAGAQPLLAERAAAATGIPLVRADQALREDVQRAAKGDCLKGEYPGGGGGLLSLPALALAAATGNCAR